MVAWNPSTRGCYSDANRSSEFILPLIFSVAETSMAEDYHLDQSDGKRYSVDPGDSAFSSISSSYSPKSSYGFRSSQQFSNGSASMSMCRQSSTSPSTFPESNRTGERSWKDKTESLYLISPRTLFISIILSGIYNAASESQESKAPSNKDPTTWCVDDVVWFIRDADPQSLGPHSDVFRKHVCLFAIVFMSGQIVSLLI